MPRSCGSSDADLVAVPVVISNNVGFAGTGFTYSYDSELTFSSAAGSLISPVTAVNSDKNIAAVTSATSHNIGEDGCLYTLLFELPSDAKSGDEYDIIISKKGVSDAFGSSMDVIVESGKIVVSGASVENPTDTGDTTVAVDTVVVSANQNYVAVPVTISNNAGFAGTGFGYTFDGNLQFLSVVSSVISKPISATNKNYVAVTSANRYDITSDGVLYYLVFALPSDAEEGTEYDIEISMSGFSNDNGSDVDVTVESGKVIVVGNEVVEPTTEEITTTSTTEAPVATTESLTVNVWGDSDSNGVVSISDVVLINKYIVGSVKLSAQSIVNADCTGDGVVNSLDSIIILGLNTQLYTTEDLPLKS